MVSHAEMRVGVPSDRLGPAAITGSALPQAEAGGPGPAGSRGGARQSCRAPDSRLLRLAGLAHRADEAVADLAMLELMGVVVAAGDRDRMLARRVAVRRFRQWLQRRVIGV